MRPSLILTAFTLVAWPCSPSRAQSSAPPTAPAALHRYEPTGLSILKPHEEGKIPVVLVHGLWSSPWSWERMVQALESDAETARRYQFWTYGYSTGDPLPYSAARFRSVLAEARSQLDPDRSDPAFGRMVVVGHSMGGLMAWMQVTSSGQSLWRGASDRGFDELRGDSADVATFRDCFFFGPSPEIARAIFIATPHRGSRVNKGSIQKLGSRLIRLPDPLTSCHRRILAANPDFFKGPLATHVPTSVDELAWGNPLITAIGSLKPREGVRLHSIIPTLTGGSGPHDSDGVVPFESAHREGVESETVVKAVHLCQDDARVAAEVRRILGLHAAENP